MKSGSEFQSVAAATSKRLYPYVEVRVLGVTNVIEFSDLREYNHIKSTR